MPQNAKKKPPKAKRGWTDTRKLGLEELLRSRLAISPDDLHHTGEWPTSRNAIYTACQVGDIESFRSGKRIIIPTAPLRRKLGMEAA